MTFNTATFRAPEDLLTDEFLLRPLRETDAKLDYDAVMESREFLRVWEQSTWPADDFTLEANRQDLIRHERQHVAGEAFTYTVMNPDETQCLGCVYIFPTTAPMYSRPEIAAVDGDAWTAYEAAFYFWVRKSRLDDGLDRRLLEALGPWFAEAWGIAHPLVITNEQFAQQVAVIESANCQLKFHLTFPNEPGKSLAYAYPHAPT
jgi:hypothetical protein